ncbi:phosphoribosylamine--glycine ligase [Candidatus Nitrospira bockiana]
MNILVIGSGGREHALVWKLAQSRRAPRLFCAPGNAGIERLARCIPIAADDLVGLKRFAVSERIDLTVVGPEAPLALGIADEFRKAKLRIFGPTRAAAQIESSKAFAKELMVRHRIPTAAAKTFEDAAEAVAYLASQPVPIVIKADGLAQGKGVIVATTREQAVEAVQGMFAGAFGDAGRRVVIEEFLQGEEATLMAFTDGKTVVPMIGAQDHKRVNDGDQGANTGGMGAYAPAPIVTPALVETVVKEVFYPAIEALARLGSPFQGVLYAGLMIVGGQPYVLEFNARLGDPETQVVLPLLDTDLVDVIEAVVEHRLDQLHVAWQTNSAVCVVLTSAGYPGRYTTGHVIRGLDVASEDVVVFHAGTARKNGEVCTAGGRVVGVTGIGVDLPAACGAAYRAVGAITYEGRHYRTDIAHRALTSLR